MIKGLWIFLFIILFCGSTTPILAATGHDAAKIRCLNCHVRLPFKGVDFRFHSDSSSICMTCHKGTSCNSKKDGGFFHPIRVVPQFTVPIDMPLDTEKKIGCMTCHLFHDEGVAEEDLYPHLLRRPPGVALCHTCHEKL